MADAKTTQSSVLNPRPIYANPDPAVVAWFANASVFHSVNSTPSANGGSNPTWGIITVANAPAVFSNILSKTSQSE